MSRPRAATSVATRIGVLPLLKALKACSLSCCVLSPCIAVAGKLLIQSQCSRESAPFFVSTKTSMQITLPLAPLAICARRRSIKWLLLSVS
nr:hypothetical protein T12_289 [Ipomoea batatas]